MKEIYDVPKTLKVRKATGIEIIRNEHLDIKSKNCLLALFNRCPKTCQIHTKWRKKIARPKPAYDPKSFRQTSGRVNDVLHRSSISLFTQKYHLKKAHSQGQFADLSSVHDRINHQTQLSKHFQLTEVTARSVVVVSMLL